MGTTIARYPFGHKMFLFMINRINNSLHTVKMYGYDLNLSVVYIVLMGC